MRTHNIKSVVGTGRLSLSLTSGGWSMILLRPVRIIGAITFNFWLPALYRQIIDEMIDLAGCAHYMATPTTTPTAHLEQMC